jgi:hypothetical protein
VYEWKYITKFDALKTYRDNTLIITDTVNRGLMCESSLASCL